jgi:hypothetical protein
MRPRPKYPPDKQMFLSKRQIRHINDHNYEATMERLRGGESEFIRLVHSEPGPQGEPVGSLRVPHHYKILLNPEKQARLEMKGALRKAKTMPPGGFHAKERKDNAVDKDKTKAIKQQAKFENDDSDVEDAFSDGTISRQKENRHSRSKSRTPAPTPKPSKHSITSPKKSPSPYALKVKSQSVPDFKAIKDVTSDGTKSPVKRTGATPNTLESRPAENTETDLQRTKSRSKSPTKSVKKSAKNQNPDKLDDLTDKAFRRRLFEHYNKTREDRNAQKSMESSLGEKKSFLRIKMADILNTSERHHSQNRILKRIADRCVSEDAEEVAAYSDNQTLPHIDTRQDTQKSQANGQRLNLPSLRNKIAPKAGDRKSAYLPTVTVQAPYNQNNNNHQSDAEHESNLENWPDIASPKAADRPSPTRSPSLPVIREDKSDVVAVFGQVLETMRKKTMGNIQNSKHKAMLLMKSCWDKKSRENDAPFEEPAEPVSHQVIMEEDEETEEEEEEENENVVVPVLRSDFQMSSDIQDCKYLRGYDPPSSRPIEDIAGFFVNASDEPKLKNVTFFHAGHFHALVNEAMHTKS